MVALTALVGLVTYLVARGLVDAAGTPALTEQDPAYWLNVGKAEIKKSLTAKHTMGRARNVIMFIGDGMGPTTVTAGRILAGQLKHEKGEDHRLSFDKFPHTGLAVTYSVDSTVTDSAASATAYTSGVKTNQGMMGLNAKATRGNCASSKGNEVKSILHWFLNEGKGAGVVTTTTVTHATPGSTYSHTPERNWEVDTFMPEDAKSCKDIARQLIEDNPDINVETTNSFMPEEAKSCKDIALGQQLIEDSPDINVILGGGMNNFKPLNYSYPRPDQTPWLVNLTKGRKDRNDLTQEWQDRKKAHNKKHRFVSSRNELNAVNTKDTDYLFGLFAEYHMQYEIERDDKFEPSLAEMTEKAIGVLQNNPNGYFLMVEGGRIDHGHHGNMPARALHDVVALSSAVQKAVNLTKEEDTLILVTADHSHVFNIAAMQPGAMIYWVGCGGKVDFPVNKTRDGMPYTTLLYGNGPGHADPRQDITHTDTSDKDYVSQSAVPMDMETHGGEDVAMYARGPQSHLYTGVHENNFIPMLMAYASCVGPYKDKKDCAPELNDGNAAVDIQGPHIAVITLLCISVHLIRQRL